MNASWDLGWHVMELVLQRLWLIGPTNPNEAHADILSKARHLLEIFGYQIVLHHVKGHQDTPERQSSNVEADLLAKNKLTLYQQGLGEYQIPYGHSACYLGNQRIRKDLSNQITDPHQWSGNMPLLACQETNH